MGGLKGRVWSVARVFVRTMCGRRRFNVLGALDFASKRVEAVCNTTYITGVEVVELLGRLAASSGDKKVWVVLDNARYQRCRAVTDAARELGVALVFLPTYSPNLNLIERVWKLVKSRVLNAAYHDTFEGFCASIDGCIGSLHTHLAAEMASLITARFQIIDKGSIV
jgi:transposase